MRRERAKIKLDAIRQKAEDIIIRQAREAIGGDRKMDRAVDELAEWVHEKWQPERPFWTLTKPVVIWLGKGALRAVLQGVYEELHSVGRV